MCARTSSMQAEHLPALHKETSFDAAACCGGTCSGVLLVVCWPGSHKHPSPQSMHAKKRGAGGSIQIQQRGWQPWGFCSVGPDHCVQEERKELRRRERVPY